MKRFLSRLHADERGISLPEVLVGLIIGGLVMTAVTSAIFTSNDLRLRAEDRSQLAADLAVLSVRFDRDVAMATSDAGARSQTSQVACTTPLDLGVLEGGTEISYRAVAGSPSGPLWIQRTGAGGTRVVARNLASCTWQAVADGTGRQAIRMTITLVGSSGETLTQLLRAAPRLW